MHTITVAADDDGIRLDRWFKRHHKEVPFTLIAKAIRKGQIKLNNRKADIATKIHVGDVLTFRLPTVNDDLSVQAKYTHPINMHTVKTLRENIIFQNEKMVVLNKPAGLATQGGSGIKESVDAMSKHIIDAELKLVHRLDKETSGLLLMATSSQAASQLSLLFKQRQLGKKYLALVKGCPRPFSGKIDLPLSKHSNAKGWEQMQEDQHGKRAITFYQVLDHAADSLALIEFTIVTGRTHQIRAHMAAIGHPIIGDDKYGSRENLPSCISNNMYLHSWQLSFTFLHDEYHFTAPLPPHFQQALTSLGLQHKTL